MESKQQSNLKRMDNMGILDQARYVAEKCGAKTVVIPDQGHFNLEKSRRTGVS